MSDPWFKFYASDWLAGTRGLTSSETGIYITLVAMMYEREEALQRDDKRLSRLCGCTKASFTKSVDALIYEGKITLVDGALSNNRVEKERKNRQEKSQKASLSAQERWKSHEKKTEQKQQTDDANAFQDGCETDAIPDARYQKPEVNDKSLTPLTPKGELESEFDRFWEYYPRKVGTGKAKVAFFKAREKATLAEIAIPLKHFVESINGTPINKIPHAATWLNQTRWKDDQTHAVNRERTSEDDMQSLGAGTASDDMGMLFSEQLAIEGKPQ